MTNVHPISGDAPEEARPAETARATAATERGPIPGSRPRLRDLPLRELVRYLVAGGWNTVFGYGVFALLTHALSGLIPYAYMVAAVLANVLAITMAYVSYKLVVFRTKGNYLREYLRFYVIYGASAVAGIALLPVFVALVGAFAGKSDAVPYVAQALLMPLLVLGSFVGHKTFSFRR